MYIYIYIIFIFKNTSLVSHRDLSSEQHHNSKPVIRCFRVLFFVKINEIKLRSFSIIFEFYSVHYKAF
jgi:hypothetical protein